MAPRAAAGNISFTVDSASEDETHDELNAFPTPDSHTENTVPTRKPRGKAAQMAKAAPATKGKGKATAKKTVAARRASGNSVLGVKKQGAAVAKKAGAKGGRKALAERQEVNGNETEEVDEFDAEDEAVAPVEVKTTRRGRPPKAKADDAPAEPAPPARKTRKAVEKEPAQKKEARSKTATKSRATKRAPADEPEPEPEVPFIPETQAEPEPMDVDIEQSIELDEIPETLPPPQRPSARRMQAQARTARQTSNGPRRAGSVSDTERDPALRRKVGELTKKLEAMTSKYDTLKEVAGSTKESNFDQLKRKTEQIAKDQDAVIKAMKQQITEMQSRSSEITSLKKETDKTEREIQRLNAENKKLSDSLASAQGDNKTLSSKLAAARSSAPPETKNIPGSAVKPRTTGVVLPGTAEATKEAQFQKQKVELYSDLTNLVILGCKKNDDDEDVYDCLQAGRNGTLHFQLTVTNDGESYEETEIWYTPLLNEQRDQELIELLPDYLTDEISFPRAQAPKFYMKVVECMGKKIELVDDVE
ncbi:hypothetical protein CC80DRAFT_590055 [Byssothecium circinans]|uniref:Monopolin complex subunit Csm1/Pcs1 C-terminal domain-containing protein n=1 Tax=Byssothecium circinans TaxID=147558 RepID=A0A6A5U702_9PLEO|nr:hypothetical protein CC80DRAFT_590055 [Byssothecium circinans]